MRVAVLVKNCQGSQGADKPPGAFAAMAQFNEELVRAGVMLGVERLHPVTEAVKVKIAASERSVIDGPFAETKEIVGGFWMWEVKSMQEAVDWLKRAPFYGEAEVEIRPVMDPEGFGPPLAPSVRA